jgi:hypothetical protein
MHLSNARSPLLAHFSAAVVGIGMRFIEYPKMGRSASFLVSVRAYGAEMTFKKESLKRVDHYVRIARMSYNLNRWIGIRIDFLGAIFTISLASYLIYGSRPLGAANTGFTLNMCLDFCTMILWWVRIFNDLEVQANRFVFYQYLCISSNIWISNILELYAVLSESKIISILNTNRSQQKKEDHQLHGLQVVIYA